VGGGQQSQQAVGVALLQVQAGAPPTRTREGTSGRHRGPVPLLLLVLPGARAGTLMTWVMTPCLEAVPLVAAMTRTGCRWTTSWAARLMTHGVGAWAVIPTAWVLEAGAGAGAARAVAGGKGVGTPSRRSMAGEAATLVAGEVVAGEGGTPATQAGAGRAAAQGMEVAGEVVQEEGVVVTTQEVVEAGTTSSQAGVEAAVAVEVGQEGMGGVVVRGAGDGRGLSTKSCNIVLMPASVPMPASGIAPVAAWTQPSGAVWMSWDQDRLLPCVHDEAWQPCGKSTPSTSIA
jgi:hypothetical protein